uniref:Serpentine receptor class gamma n=1 Tax=Steinernema glaseri TaxID=37863 RepID=A0A1I7YUG7_9BILA
MLVVSLLYGIFSLVLYVVILVQLVRPKYEKRFNNPFFKLCFLLGVVDCVGYIIFYVFFTLATYSIFAPFYSSSFFTPGAFTSGIYFSTYFFGYLQLFGNCFLTFNRFTSIVFPLKHNRIWKLFFPISIIATVISSVAPCWQLLSASAYYNRLFNTPDSGYGMNYDHSKYPSHSNSFNMFLSNFVACCFCLVLNVTSSVFLVIHTSRTVGAASKNRRAELNLFFMALLIFVFQAIYGVHQVVIFVATKAKNDWVVVVLYTLVPWISDLKFLSPPWILVIVSTSVREAVIQALPTRVIRYHKQWSSVGSSVTVTTVTVKQRSTRL